MENSPIEIYVDKSNIRLDIFLHNSFKERFSRSYIQKIIKEKKIKIYFREKEISENKIKPSLLLESGMKILIENLEIQTTLEIKPIEVKFDILYEDEFLAIIHKPPGISVHPGENQKKEEVTILNGILYHWKNLQEIQSSNPSIRPGIVHRLDKMTEGILVIAKNSTVQWKLGKLFQTRNIKKTYIAWLLGTTPKEKDRIELPLKRNPKDRRKMTVDLEGRMAITEYEITKVIISNHNRKFCKVNINLITGRTHQIRAHFHYLKCPVIGDTLYATMDTHLAKYGLLLLAKAISFNHPETKQNISVEIPEPERFLEFEKKCKYY